MALRHLEEAQKMATDNPRLLKFLTPQWLEVGSFYDQELTNNAIMGNIQGVTYIYEGQMFTESVESFIEFSKTFALSTGELVPLGCVTTICIIPVFWDSLESKGL